MLSELTCRRNEPRLNWRWSLLDYMQLDQVLDLMEASVKSIEKGIPSSVIKRVLFESAEGAYSQLMFAMPDIRVLVAGRMFSDKSLLPVMWVVRI